MSKLGWIKKENNNGKSFYTQCEQKTIYVAHTSTSQVAEAINSEETSCYQGQGLTSYRVSQQGIKLPKGAYVHYPESCMANTPERLVSMELRSDKYIRIPSLSDPLEKDIKEFIDSEDYFKSIETLFKRGYLFYGPPGTGKTTLVRETVKHLIPKNSVVITCTGIPSDSFLENIRVTLSDVFKILIFEELASCLNEENTESFLNFTDGEKSLDKCLILATTNYPERLPISIVSRPSRFDNLIYVGDPNKDERALLLTHYLKRTPTQDEINSTDKMSAAAIKEICFIVHKSRSSVAEASAILKKHKELVKRDFNQNGKKIGFE